MPDDTEATAHEHRGPWGDLIDPDEEGPEERSSAVLSLLGSLSTCLITSSG